MELGVGERIRLLTILPEQGNLLTIKIVRSMREELSFSEEEHKKYKIVPTGDRIMWDETAEPKDIEFGSQALEVIEKSLRELNEKDELTVPDIALWEKFIGEI